MSEDLDNIINNWNEQITNTAYTKETTSKSIFEELKNISNQIDADPDVFTDFSVETHGHFDACVDYNQIKNAKCICNIILNMVYSARKLKEQFKNQIRNEKEEENNQQ
ncbi:MAG: hypothetical protein FI692_01650 [SAR202 cluster bacterium]|nr:hypothetical protein [SAR202 cluster bacterium]